MTAEQLAAAEKVLGITAEKDQNRLEKEREMEKKTHAAQLEREVLKSGLTGAEAESLKTAGTVVVL